MGRPRRFFVALLASVGVGCAFFFLPAASSSQQAPGRPPTPAPATLFGVGDIMHCSAPDGAEATGQLMERLLNETPNSIGVTFGDNSNDDGSEASYDCFNRSTWGRLMAFLRPSPGNHDYESDPILPFYSLYFPHARPQGVTYYSYEWGPWHIVALDSELMGSENDMKQRRQAQLAWLESDLRQHANTKCVMAYFHRPPFSSGRFASPRATPLFRKLYKYGADLIATGHEHFFAALPPLNPDGVVDKSWGIPVLIAGTGGAVFFPRPKTPRWSEEIIAGSLGILRVTLHAGSYEWRFVPVNPLHESPSARGTCHDNPTGYIE